MSTTNMVAEKKKLNNTCTCRICDMLNTIWLSKKKKKKKKNWYNWIRPLFIIYPPPLHDLFVYVHYDSAHWHPIDFWTPNNYINFLIPLTKTRSSFISHNHPKQAVPFFDFTFTSLFLQVLYNFNLESATIECKSKWYL